MVLEADPCNKSSFKATALVDFGCLLLDSQWALLLGLNEAKPLGHVLLRILAGLQQRREGNMSFTRSKAWIRV